MDRPLNNPILPLYPSGKDYVSRTRGTNLYDSEGKKYIDFESGVWCTNLGHNYKPIIKEIRAVAGKLLHHGYRFNNCYADDLAKKLSELNNFSEGSSVFLSSGSEAINLSVKIARHITGRKKILKINNSYLSAFGFGEEAPENTDLIRLEYNNNDETDKIDFSEIAAFVMETGGASVDVVRFPDNDFLEKIYSESVKNGVIIIADEITTGFGRTGKMFGYQHYNVSPDIVVTGKGLGNGYPISAVTVNGKIREDFVRNPFVYAQSHQNDALGCAIGLKVTEIFENTRIIEKSEVKGEYFLKRLKKLATKFPDKIKDVRGRGLLLAMEINESINFSELEKYLIDAGYLLGFKKNTLRYLPPLVITKKEIRNHCKTLRKFFSGEFEVKIINNEEKNDSEK